MALTERTIIKSVNHLPELNSLQIQWANQVLRDGVVIAEQYHRKAYVAGQQAEFMQDLGSAAAKYVPLLSW